jgi:hypothetical protein
MEIRSNLFRMGKLLLVELEVVDAFGPSRVDVDSSHRDIVFMRHELHFWYVFTRS